MKLIVGLGNPGREYDRTRHNAGFMVVDELARRHAAGETPRSRFQGLAVECRVGSGDGTGEKALLLKPMTYMNRSGQAVQEALRFYKLEAAEDLVVVVDDLALPVGSVRVRSKGGSGGHNGLADIDQKLGFGGGGTGATSKGTTGGYARVRVGIGAKPAMMAQADWVLSRFTEEEAGGVERSVSAAADAVAHVAVSGVEAAMNRFNEKVKTAEASEGSEAREETHPGWTGGAGGGAGGEAGW